MLRVGVIGLGYWGPNLARVFDGHPEVDLRVLCDLNPRRRADAGSRFPRARVTGDVEEVFGDTELDAVVIATPSRTHYPLALRALRKGLHTFVEKPLALSSAECQHLEREAAARGLVLFVGHIFLYTAAIAKLKALVDAGELGKVTTITGARRNLGPARADVSALWDLAPHDISVILHLLGEQPVSVNCQGMSHLRPSIHDVCVLTMHFASGVMALVHSSWLDPNKVREMTIVGTRKMVVYDDLAPLEKIKVYDKGVEAPPYHSDFGEFAYSYRYGDTFSPRLIESEPLKAECVHFVECVRNGLSPLTDGRNGTDVVRVLEAAERSLQANGMPILLDSSEDTAPLRLAVAS